ncbi:MAG: ribosome biogenesis GTPase Der [Oscillospiraceae bacterium]|jgi:GTP-binding protein|nr:ribosome biogenesis GTPase Der [Oscillospiraceae bacterium]
MTVAIVGRPNVGKSTLFNKLVGRRVSIVDDTPGVTRDRIYAKCEWRGREFMLVDTGGIEPKAADEIFAQMQRQSEIAIAKADVIVLICDLKSSVTQNDYAVAELLHRSGKPVILAVNKCDSVGSAPIELYEFYNLGIGEPFPISAVHGHGTGELLDEIFKYFSEEPITDEDAVKVAVIGKPNAGKSSLINKIAGEERVIVSAVAGTTRDATDTSVENAEGKFVFIDTAGLRKKSRVTESLEHYSNLRAYMAVDRADVCVIMIDAQTGFTEQDSKIAGYAHQQGKASIVAVNKWDSIEKTDKTMKEYEDRLKKDFSFMSYVPFIFISAKTGLRIDKLFSLIKYVSEQNAMRISTGTLNDIVSYAIARVPPPTDKGKRLKIYYITQASTKPPKFVIFVNNAELFHFSYQRYIENQIRLNFALEGTPVQIVIRERDSKS